MTTDADVLPPLRRAGWVLAFGTAQSCAYFALNRHPPSESRLLPLSALDAALPFWPASVWAYLALLACELVLPLCVRSRSEFRRMASAYVLSMGAAFATYALFPTRYPRPPPPTGDTLSDDAYRLLVALDRPECCLPSGHVIVPVLAAWALARDRRAPWPLVLVVLLLPSVLTTKQHYVWDVAAALVLVAASYALTARFGPHAPRGR